MEVGGAMNENLSDRPMRKRLLEIAARQASESAQLLRIMLINGSMPKLEDLLGVRKRLDAAKVCLSQCRRYVRNEKSRSKARAEAKAARAAAKGAGV